MGVKCDKSFIIVLDLARAIYDASVIGNYSLSVANVELGEATRKRGGIERKRGRDRHPSSRDLRNGSCTHDRIRISLRASGHSRVEPWFWAPAHEP
ncbi:hypothetical protein ALC60_08859 [Trachymyrmex zeteki]|uniref:Uncharacterized protein n=1 Tax=Mycetomoellerius zeteki TaxID=64791 RepID=A0A151WWG2_9HYME|nr:hypothetical protein ALC60_08859 [Trachymyrmex zeteki]